MAREAAKAADDRKLAAVKAAEEAKKDTEQATLLAAAKAAEGAKKDAQQTELAALSKEDTTKLDLFDGVWTIVRVVGVGANCLDRSHVTFTLTVKGFRASGKSSVIGPGGDTLLSGAVSGSGALTFSHKGKYDGDWVRYSGVLRGKSGSGSFVAPGRPCKGTFTAMRK